MSVDFSLGEESDVYIPEKVSSPAPTPDCPFSVTMNLFFSRRVPPNVKHALSCLSIHPPACVLYPTSGIAYR